MTVKELIKELKQCPPEAIVIMQKDAEGNSYSPLSVVDSNCVYVPECTWSGEVYSKEWTADDMCMSDEYYEEIMSGPTCVCLAPAN